VNDDPRAKIRIRGDEPGYVRIPMLTFDRKVDKGINVVRLPDGQEGRGLEIHGEILAGL
jgi:hypothetical protein